MFAPRKATLHCINRRQLCRKKFPLAGLDAPTPARIGTGRPKGRSHFSFATERKVCKRKPAARRLQRRPAPLRVAGFGLREPNGWMPRIYSGHPIPALRPEQSDHVPWADCPQGLSSTLVRFAHPSGKKPLIAHFDSGARNVARNGIGQLSPALGARSCSPFSAVKMGGPFSLRCLSPLCSPAGGAGQTQIAALGMLRCGWAGFAAQKNRIDFFFCDWRYPYANSVAWDALV